MTERALEVRLRFIIRFGAILMALIALAGASAPARALEPISVPLDEMALDLTDVVERYADAGTRLQVSTAPGADGIVRRIEVR
ncbi:MAG: hypothetical protein KDJ16_11675, partial [Hyphomicrobiales bacterium]|nr:hypothetical protein [Hyphomicrobiales bacterium]